jgi:hypothetical protein
VETDETNETTFFIVCVVKGLGHEKKRKILKIAKKCYFFIHSPHFGNKAASVPKGGETAIPLVAGEPGVGCQNT